MTIRVDVRDPIQCYYDEKQGGLKRLVLFCNLTLCLEDVRMKILDGHPVQVVEFEYERKKLYFLFVDIPTDWQYKIRSASL